MDSEAIGRSIRDRVGREPLRRPPFDPEAIRQARELDRRADRIHRRADESDDQLAELRRQACALERRADDLVPREWR